MPIKPRRDKKPKEIEINMERLSAPLQLGIMVNSLCNLDCVYCYAQPFTMQQMPTLEAVRIIDEAHKLGVFKLTIEGGEPMLHKDIFPILEHCLQYGFEMDLVSNGTRIDEKNALKLKNLADKYVNWTGVQVSLDSMDPKINDVTRGKGALVIQNLHMMLDLGVPTSLGIVVTHSNVNRLEEIVDEFYPQVMNFHFIRIMPTWKSVQNFRELAIRKEDYPFLDIAREKFNAMMEKNEGLEITMLKDKDDFPHIAEVAKFPCAAGHTMLVIKPDLTVSICDLSLGITVGDLHQQTIKQVWDSVVLQRLNAMNVRACVLSVGRGAEPYMINEKSSAFELALLRRTGQDRMDEMRTIGGEAAKARRE